PTVDYQPWLQFDGTAYPEASIPNTRVAPRQAATIALAGWLEEANDRSRIQLLNGMHLPNGTQYRLVGNNNCGGLQGGNQWREVTQAGGHNVNQNCAVYIRYWPATFYTRWISDTDDWPELEGATNVYNSTTAPRV